jgi:hypothetical protein
VAQKLALCDHGSSKWEASWTRPIVSGGLFAPPILGEEQKAKVLDEQIPVAANRRGK